MSAWSRLLAYKSEFFSIILLDLLAINNTPDKISSSPDKFLKLHNQVIKISTQYQYQIVQDTLEPR